MADISIFRHFDLVTLQAMLAGAQTAVTTGNGQTIVKYTLGGREVEKQFAMRLEDFINSVIWALEYKDPTNYTPLADRMRATFNGGTK